MNSTTEVVSESLDEEVISSQSQASTHTTVDGLYAKYVLAILVLMGIFNFIDR